MTAISDLHLLLVDDNRQMRALLRCVLRAGGILKMTEAGTVGEALDAMRTAPIDLVIADWKMAPIDGLAFTRMVRTAPDSPNPYIPIIMLTAHTEMSRVAAARDAGVTGFVRKPVSARMLFDRLSSALTDTRMFVRTADFFGPDRRHGQAPDYAGPFRRQSDTGIPHLGDTFDIDDERWSA